MWVCRHAALLELHEHKEPVLLCNASLKCCVPHPMAVVALLLSFGAGEISINSSNTEDMSRLRNLVGFVPQDDVMHGELTVKENVLFNALLRVPRSQMP